MKNIFTFFIASFLFCSSSDAQETGSFQITVDFPQTDYNETRTLYFYVPETYDSDIAYKILVGFRGGPNTNAGQFRDQLQSLSDSLNAIILCPENADHFWNQEGRTKLLFQYSLDTAMAMYNIDPDFIYLTGLSYGGRHAVIVATDTDDGPIPNLRGVIPFAAGADSHLQPNYDSINDFAPACICIGLSDSNNFISVANSLHSDIQSNGGASMLNEIPNVGHTVAFSTFPSEMMECFNFIESQYEPNTVNDLSDKNSELIVFPNPATDVVQFSFLNNNKKVMDIKLMDSSGRLLKTIHKNAREINIAEFKKNKILLLSITTEEGTFIKKIMK